MPSMYNFSEKQVIIMCNIGHHHNAREKFRNAAKISGQTVIITIIKLGTCRVRVGHFSSWHFSSWYICYFLYSCKSMFAATCA